MVRRRTRPVLKWSATIVAVLMLAFTVATFWYDFKVRGLGVLVGACVGQVRVVHSDTVVPSDTGARAWGAYVDPAGPWYVETTLSEPLLPAWDSMLGAWWAYAPLWPFVVLPGILAVWLWRRDRRPGPGHCQRCGYNLTGNVSGICPECGEAI